MKIKVYLQSKQRRVNQSIVKYLPPADKYPPLIHQAMRYSVLAGGKRLRPILALMAAELLGGKEKAIMPTACALEFIHTYSLIHDDLPAMDNDDFRRGIPTCHKKYNEAIAILAGDALLTYAFWLTNHNIKDTRLSRRVIEEISKAIGSEGMIGGQVLDITNSTKKVRSTRVLKEVVYQIYLRKTAALIAASVRVGAIMAGASAKEVKALTRYAHGLGLAFQMIDDVLDIEGESKQLGKTPRKDIAQQKLTYPAILGIKETRKQASNLIKRSKQSLNSFGPKADLLRELADYVIGRNN
jgi:geranylgeranyl diphosphate synthase, type II